jgi:hypothetical protein
MPPRIPDSTSTHTHPAATQVETSKESTAAAETPAPEQSKQPQQDPNTAAKVAQGSKHHAGEHQSDNNFRSKMARKDLTNRLPAMKEQKTPEKKLDQKLKLKEDEALEKLLEWKAKQMEKKIEQKLKDLE